MSVPTLGSCRGSGGLSSRPSPDLGSASGTLLGGLGSHPGHNREHRVQVYMADTKSDLRAGPQVSVFNTLSGLWIPPQCMRKEGMRRPPFPFSVVPSGGGYKSQVHVFPKLGERGTTSA